MEDQLRYGPRRRFVEVDRDLLCWPPAMSWTGQDVFYRLAVQSAVRGHPSTRRPLLLEPNVSKLRPNFSSLLRNATRSRDGKTSERRTSDVYARRLRRRSFVFVSRNGDY